jgi:curli production assembly/transport component CsgE
MNNCGKKSIRFGFSIVGQGSICFLICCFFLCFINTGVCQTKSNIPRKDTISAAPPELLKLYESIVIEKKAKQSNANEIEIDGLIFDETRSKVGHQFYEEFFNNWEPPAGVSNFSIYISEIPFMVNVSLISVKVNDYEVINTRLQPRNDFITSLANDAVNMTKEALINMEDIKKQIEIGDQIGSGIY